MKEPLWELHWEMLHPKMTMAHLGLLPSFINPRDGRGAIEQLDSNYQHGGGWTNIPGFMLDTKTFIMQYPGDPPFEPLAKATLRDETILFYDHALVGVLQKDGSFQVSRID